MFVSLDIEAPTTMDGDGLPAGLTLVTGQDPSGPGSPPGNTGKVVGSADNDRCALFDVQKDADGVVTLGEGDDVFVFGPNDVLVDLNGIVKMGIGDADHVYLNGRVMDYVFKTREIGEGIKIQFIDEPDDVGDAITFYEAELFTFRNITDNGNYINQTYTHDELYNLIKAAEFMV